MAKRVESSGVTTLYIKCVHDFGVAKGALKFSGEVIVLL